MVKPVLAQQYVSIDADSPMLEQARRRYPDAEFIQADMTTVRCRTVRLKA